jgi:DNA-binding response OmpR family regulator
MPRAVSTEQLLHKVWADSDCADPAYVWVTVRRLRQKIELDADEPHHLVTVPGGGYRLAAWELRGNYNGRQP